MFGVVSGGHFNPAITLGAAAIRRINPIDAAHLHARPALGRRARGAAGEGAVDRRGEGDPLRCGDRQPPAREQFRGRDHRGHRHLLPGAGDPRRGLLEKELQGVGAAGDRHDPGLHRHGRRPADRRLLQPRPLVRPGARRQRVGRRLALPGRPDRRLAAGRRRLPVRARARRSAADRIARAGAEAPAPDTSATSKPATAD